MHNFDKTQKKMLKVAFGVMAIGLIGMAATLAISKKKSRKHI